MKSNIFMRTFAFTVIWYFIGITLSTADIFDGVTKVGKPAGLPCTTYVLNVLTQSGVDIQTKLPNSSDTIESATQMNYGDDFNSKLYDLVTGKDERTKGVVRALVGAGLGTEIQVSGDLTSLQRGDIIQYWYDESPIVDHTKPTDSKYVAGHTAIVEKLISPHVVQVIASGGPATNKIVAESNYALGPKTWVIYAVRPNLPSQ